MAIKHERRSHYVPTHRPTLNACCVDPSICDGTPQVRLLSGCLLTPRWNREVEGLERIERCSNCFVETLNPLTERDTLHDKIECVKILTYSFWGKDSQAGSKIQGRPNYGGRTAIVTELLPRPRRATATNRSPCTEGSSGNLTITLVSQLKPGTVSIASTGKL